MSNLPEPGPIQREQVLYLVELSDSFRRAGDHKVADAWEAHADQRAAQFASSGTGWRHLPAWVKQERERRAKERT